MQSYRVVFAVALVAGCGRVGTHIEGDGDDAGEVAGADDPADADDIASEDDAVDEDDNPGEVVAEPVPPAASVTTIGLLEQSGTARDGDELTAADATPTYVVGSGTNAQVRPWIGVSECTGCGGAKAQRIRFPNLDIGAQHWLIIRPGYVSSAAGFRAVVVEGAAKITGGATFSWAPTGAGGWLPRPVTIAFVAETSDLTLELRSTQSRGNHYLYIDQLELTINQPASACVPVRYYRFRVAREVAMYCVVSSATNERPVLDVDIPDTGNAVARATLSVRQGTSNRTIHFWGARVAIGDRRLQHAAGDDLYPGATFRGKTVVGAGTLLPNNRRLLVTGYSGAQGCVSGLVSVLPESVAEVWVESPNCRGRDIAMANLYANVGTKTLWYWPTSAMAPAVTTSFDVQPRHRMVEVIGAIEGSPVGNTVPAHMYSQVTVDALGILDTRKDIPLIGSGGGMMHLVLGPQRLINRRRTPLADGIHRFHLQAGKAFLARTSTGGCCGDATLAVVGLP